MEGKKRIAGVDYDETCVDFVGEENAFLYFYNQRHGTSFRKNDINFYDMEKALKISKKQIIKELNLFYLSQAFLRLKPLDFAADGLRFLKRTHSLMLITSRPESTEISTLKNVSLNFPEIYEKVFFVDREKKISKCLELKTTLLIEDDLTSAIMAADEGIEVFLLDREWNRDGRLPYTQKIHRMGNHEENPNCGWKEIIEELNRRKWK